MENPSNLELLEQDLKETEAQRANIETSKLATLKNYDQQGLRLDLRISALKVAIAAEKN